MSVNLKTPVPGGACDPLTQGSYVIGKQACADIDVSTVQKMVKESFDKDFFEKTTAYNASFMGRLNTAYGVVSKYVDELGKTVQKSYNRAFKIADKCVSEGKGYVTSPVQGPLREGKVSRPVVLEDTAFCGYAKSAKEFVSAQWAKLPAMPETNIMGTLSSVAAAVTTAYTEMNSKYSASAKIFGKDVTVGACDVTVGVVALGATALAVKALTAPKKKKETGYKLNIV